MDLLICHLQGKSGISREELLAELCRMIGPAEREALAGDTGTLVISRYNRRTLLRMLEYEKITDSGRASR